MTDQTGTQPFSHGIPAPDPMARIASALERLAAAAEKLVELEANPLVRLNPDGSVTKVAGFGGALSDEPD